MRKEFKLACIALAAILAVSGCSENNKVEKTDITSGTTTALSGAVVLTDATISAEPAASDDTTVTSDIPDATTSAEPAASVDTTAAPVTQGTTISEEPVVTEQMTVDTEPVVTTSEPDISSEDMTTEQTTEPTPVLEISVDPSRHDYEDEIYGAVVDNGSKFDKAMSAYSFNLLYKACRQDVESGKNVFISPFSISYALALTANGAVDETQQQILDLIAPDMTIDELNSNMGTIMAKMLADNELVQAHKKADEDSSSSDWSEHKYGVALNLANSIWANNLRFIPKDSYIAKMQDIYSTEVMFKDFDDTTYLQINDWVNTETWEMIPDLLPYGSVTADTASVLVNAVAFEGSWANAENVTEYKDETFTNSSGVAETCTMISHGGSKFFFDSQAVAFTKNYYSEYGADTYAFMAILPNEDVSVESYMHYLSSDPANFRRLWLSDQKEYNATWRNKTTGETYQKRTPCEYLSCYGKIPEFTLDYTANLLTDYLKSIMPLPFDVDEGKTPDFSEMGIPVRADDDHLYISDVIHKTHIELDKNGTKAAAATAVLMAPETSAAEFETHDELLPIEVNLDRPFIYAIVNTSNGMPIFLGVLNTTGD